MSVIEPSEIIPPGGRSSDGSSWPQDWRSRLAGVLVSRVFAYLVDLLAIGLLVWFYGFVAAFFGLFTLGLTWLIFPVLVPLVALLYNGFTLSGPRAATWGMRLAGVEVRNIDGSRVSFLTAAGHALLFYLSCTMLTPMVLLIGLFRSDRRMVHDLLTGVIIVRTITI
jgi:uncharacterized RDD family membrane protein YckC